jgi:hypothetical protein
VHQHLLAKSKIYFPILYSLPFPISSGCALRMTALIRAINSSSSTASPYNHQHQVKSLQLSILGFGRQEKMTGILLFSFFISAARANPSFLGSITSRMHIKRQAAKRL